MKTKMRLKTETSMESKIERQITHQDGSWKAMRWDAHIEEGDSPAVSLSQYLGWQQFVSFS